MSDLAPTPLKFSAIVASRHRPTWLKTCLSGLRQQDYPNFEIVVVADCESLAGIDDPRIKCVTCEDANLSKARNIGIAHSGGDICAFIDDDAVPEPLWLHHLASAFRETSAVAVTGYVRGRNGLSFQSKAHTVDGEAETHAFALDADVPTDPDVPEGHAMKLVGTNMAIRRDILVKAGGFDESFRFYLDDSDLSMRLANMGRRIGVQPLAQVHHGFAPSSRRTARRAPLNLFEIGRSTAIFLRKHGDLTRDDYWRRLKRRERRRLVQHMVAGTCEPRDVGARIAGLRDGWQSGLTANFEDPPTMLAKEPFHSFPAAPASHEVFASPWFFKRAHLVHAAEKIVESGGRASVFSFSLTPVRHHVRYVGSGVWLQSGGVYGRSDRNGPVFKWCRFAERLRGEIRRVAKFRGIGENEYSKWWDHSRL